MESITGKVINLSCLYNRLQGLTDRRKAKGKRYALATILLGMFLAKLCGEDKASGIAEWVALRGKWIASELGLKRKSMPSHPAIINNLVIALIAKSNFLFVPSARRYFAAHPGSALNLLLW